jgi:centromeric protein E
MDNIRVAARVRPFNERERNEKASVRWEVNEKDNTMSEKRACVSSSMATYVFDRVYNMDATNFSIFTEFVQPIVASVVKGFHGTIFAYGQTSSGKTHTMMGSPDNPGIIPLSLKYIFASIHRNPTREFLLRVSYIEIYNEVITDLLQPSKTNLKIKENTQKEVIVECSEKCLSSVKMALELIAEGEKNRHFGETLMNEKSSRSHTVFTIIVESREATGDGDQDYERAVQVAKLNLVDLAGSERVSQTGSEGIRLKEGGFINRSLFHLGNVIHKLSERDGGHVPFRESKLTRLLQTSLGGNAHTRIICNITATAVEETHSTLKFASRAKTIENNPHVNEVLSDGALLQRYRTQITDLQRQLQETGIGELRSENERLALEAQQSSEERVQLTSKIRQLERFVLTCSRETRHQLKSKSKAALRRQTVCPSVLSRNLADDMYLEPVEEDEEQDSWFLPSKISIERDIYSDERRVTGSSTPQLKNVTSFSPVDAVLMSSGSANSSHSVAELEQKITTLQEKLDNKDSELMAMLNKQCAEKEQLHNELDMSKKELARTALQSKALMAKNTELEKKLNSCVEANKAENEELVALRNRVKITEKENAHLTEAKDHLEKQLSPVQKKCDEMEDDLQKSRRLQVQVQSWNK